MSNSSENYSLSSLVNTLATTLGKVISFQEGPEALSLVEKVRQSAKVLRTTSDPKVGEELAQAVLRRGPSEVTYIYFIAHIIDTKSLTELKLGTSLSCGERLAPIHLPWR